MLKRIAGRSILPVVGVVLVGLLVMQSRTAAGSRSVTPVVAPASLAGDRVAAEGHVVAYPGGEVAVGADLGGTVDRVLVRERDTVRVGQLLAEIRSTDLRAELDEARARVHEADADIRLYEAETARARDLWEREVGSRQGYEQRQRDLDAARARRMTAMAAVERLEAVLAKTRIVSPIDGTVVARAVDAGESIDAGKHLLTVANLSRLRLEAEIDEYDVGRIALGAPVRITAEGYPGKSWRGHVEEIPDSVVARTLKSQDPARPTDTAVLLVKIAFDELVPLKLGQRVDVEVAFR